MRTKSGRLDAAEAYVLRPRHGWRAARRAARRHVNLDDMVNLGGNGDCQSSEQKGDVVEVVRASNTEVDFVGKQGCGDVSQPRSLSTGRRLIDAYSYINH
jgi:hypothetical protein